MERIIPPPGTNSYLNHTPTTPLYTLSLHDALPISLSAADLPPSPTKSSNLSETAEVPACNVPSRSTLRSEERFSRNAETDLVCRLLLEKKNTPEQILSATKEPRNQQFHQRIIEAGR